MLGSFGLQELLLIGVLCVLLAAPGLIIALVLWHCLKPSAKGPSSSE